MKHVICPHDRWLKQCIIVNSRNNIACCANVNWLDTWIFFLLEKTIDHVILFSRCKDNSPLSSLFFLSSTASFSQSNWHNYVWFDARSLMHSWSRLFQRHARCHLEARRVSRFSFRSFLFSPPSRFRETMRLKRESFLQRTSLQRFDSDQVRSVLIATIAFSIDSRFLYLFIRAILLLLDERRPILVWQYDWKYSPFLALLGGHALAVLPRRWHHLQRPGDSCFSKVMATFNGDMRRNAFLLVVRHDALQRPRNYFLINLAVTDLGLLLTNNTMHIISSFRKQWIFGQWGMNRAVRCCFARLKQESNEKQLARSVPFRWRKWTILLI